MNELLASAAPAALASAIFIAIFFVASLWAASLAVNDSSIVDFFWGPTSAAVAWAAFLESDRALTLRIAIVLAAVTLWGARLGLYLLRRNWGQEDKRYVKMREKAAAQGRNWALTSLRNVFVLQGAVMWIVTLPLVAAVAVPRPDALGIATWIGAAIWLAGFLIESIADAQMARFRARRKPGEVMDRGLWRYSRHPNYFGEILVQWAYFLFACDVGVAALATIFAPILMTYLISGPTGTKPVENELGAKNAAYADYMRRTSMLIPLPRRRA